MSCVFYFWQLESFTAQDDDGYNGNDGEPVNTTMEVHPSDTDFSSLKLDQHDYRLIDTIVRDNQQSPSKYHSPKLIHSNIPSSKAKPLTPKTPKRSAAVRRSGVQPTQTSIVKEAYPDSQTSRSDDLIDTHADKFTEHKPFTPRTIKYKQVPSKLSQFKYYMPPCRKIAKEMDASHTESVAVSGNKPVPRRRKSLQRSETPMTDTPSLMNETLLSRDMKLDRSRSGVPPLDISLDADHIRWLQEQSHKAHLRMSYRSGRSDTTSDLGSMQLPADIKRDLNASGPMVHMGTMNGTLGASQTLGGIRTLNTTRSANRLVAYI